MKIVAHDKFNNPVIMDATSLVVLDDHDNPVMCALVHQKGHIQAAHILDKDFHMLASMLGFDNRIVVAPYSGHSPGVGEKWPSLQTRP